MSHAYLHRLIRLSATGLLALSPLLCHAQAYKCTDNGNTVYQSQPCKGAGKEVQVAPPPSEQDVEDARKRAKHDRERLADVDSQYKDKQAMNRNRGNGADCESINKAVADAQEEYMRLAREGAAAGTPAGMRNNQQQAMAAQQRLNNAKQNAAMFGCTGSSQGSGMMH